MREYAGLISPINVQADALLLPFPTASLDYLCASHVIEHLPNPTYGMLEWHRVLRPGGLLYLVIPDKRFTFDVARATTSAEHLITEFRAGVTEPTPDHVHDFVFGIDWHRLLPNSPVEGHAAEKKLHFDTYVSRIHSGEDVDIHFHTFTPDSFEVYIGGVGLVAGFAPLFDQLDLAERFPPERGDGIGVLLRKRGTKRAAKLETFMLPGDSRTRNNIPLVCPATLMPLTPEGENGSKLRVKDSAVSYQVVQGVPNLVVPRGAQTSRPWDNRWFRERLLLKAAIGRLLRAYGHRARVTQKPGSSTAS